MGLISRVSSRTYRKSMNYVQFLKTVGQLKNTARTGWKIRNVPNFESVADHSWRMSLMALTFENLPKNVDRELAVKMCVVRPRRVYRWKHSPCRQYPQIRKTSTRK